jgi:iron complex outermembrane receptor protein
VINNWLSWAFMPQWEGHLGVQWVGAVYNDDANTVKRPPSTVVNLGLDYDVTKNSEISFWLFNAFDEVYATGGSATEWQLAPPRSAELSYRIKY